MGGPAAASAPVAVPEHAAESAKGGRLVLRAGGQAGALTVASTRFT